jgi:hypothetical protein
MSSKPAHINKFTLSPKGGFGKNSLSLHLEG